MEGEQSIPWYVPQHAAPPSLQRRKTSASSLLGFVNAHDTE